MENQNTSEEPSGKKKRSPVIEFFMVGDVFGYFFRKKNKDQVPNVNTRIMHGINRIAIIIFLIGVIYMVLKRLL